MGRVGRRRSLVYVRLMRGLPFSLSERPITEMRLTMPTTDAFAAGRSHRRLPEYRLGSE